MDAKSNHIESSTSSLMSQKKIIISHTHILMCCVRIIIIPRPFQSESSFVNIFWHTHCDEDFFLPNSYLTRIGDWMWGVRKGVRKFYDAWKVQEPSKWKLNQKTSPLIMREKLKKNCKNLCMYEIIHATLSMNPLKKLQHFF